MKWKFQATVAMTSVPTTSPIRVPTGPASGRNEVQGMTNESQPSAQPKASAQAARGERKRDGEFVILSFDGRRFYHNREQATTRFTSPVSIAAVAAHGRFW